MPETMELPTVPPTPSGDESRLDRIYQEHGEAVTPQDLRNSAEGAGINADALFRQYGNNPPPGIPSPEVEGERAQRLSGDAHSLEQQTSPPESHPEQTQE